MNSSRDSKPSYCLSLSKVRWTEQHSNILKNVGMLCEGWLCCESRPPVEGRPFVGKTFLKTERRESWKGGCGSMSVEAEDNSDRCEHWGRFAVEQGRRIDPLADGFDGG